LFLPPGKNITRQRFVRGSEEISMALKNLISFLLGIGLLAYTVAAQGGYTIEYHYPLSDSGPKTYAILVGSDAPAADGSPALRGDLDVDNVASKLTWASAVYLLKYHWNDANTVAADVQGAASAIASQLNPGDHFIFYYSGHGTGGSAPGVQDFINPVHGDGYQDDALTSVFADSPYTGAKKLFMIDSCHSDGMWWNDTDADHDLQTLTNISFLASSSADGLAFADGDQNGTSFFTNALLPSLTPNTSFGTLLTSAMAIGGDVSGYLKDDGIGSGAIHPSTHSSVGFDLDATLGGQPVPEPAALVLLLAGAATALIWRRRIG
jgi:hypothetical protein